MSSAPQEQVTLNISDVVYRGKGLARLDGCVYFVPGTLPGEKVQAQVVKRHKRYVDAKLETVLEPSPDRIEPPCPLAGTCPGCTYQHTTYANEVRLKQAQQTDLLQRMGGVADPPDAPPVPSPLELGYRNKIVLHARRHEDQVLLGYIGEDNRTVLDIPACPLAHPAINSTLETVRGDQDYLRTLQRRHGLTLRHTETDGVLFWNRPPVPDAPRLTEHTTLGDLSVPQGSFFQVNPPVADLLTDALMEWIKETDAGYVIDLYCGVGLFACAAARAGVKSVLGIDIDGQAIRAGHDNAQALACPDVEFAQAHASGLVRQAVKAVPATETAVICDPPRRGMDQAVREVICDLKPKHVFYVSCAADTLARDTRQLLQAGYRLHRCRLFDMFPRTAFFESAAWFTID